MQWKINFILYTYLCILLSLLFLQSSAMEEFPYSPRHCRRMVASERWEDARETWPDDCLEDIQSKTTLRVLAPSAFEVAVFYDIVVDQGLLWWSSIDIKVAFIAPFLPMIIRCRNFWQCTYFRMKWTIEDRHNYTRRITSLWLNTAMCVIEELEEIQSVLTLSRSNYVKRKRAFYITIFIQNM